MKRVTKSDLRAVTQPLRHAEVIESRDRFEFYSCLVEAGAMLDELRARVREEIRADLERVGLSPEPGEAPVALDEWRTASEGGGRR